VDISKIVSDQDRKQIETAIEQHGTETLKTLRESLPGDISYNMIRFVIAELSKRLDN